MIRQFACSCCAINACSPQKKKKKKSKAKAQSEGGNAGTAPPPDPPEAAGRFTAALNSLAANDMWVDVGRVPLTEKRVKKLVEAMRQNRSATSLDLSGGALLTAASCKVMMGPLAFLP